MYVVQNGNLHANSRLLCIGGTCTGRSKLGSAVILGCKDILITIVWWVLNSGVVMVCLIDTSLAEASCHVVNVVRFYWLGIERTLQLR